MKTSARNLCDILDAKLVAGSETAEVTSVFTDTRKAEQDGLFVALKGESFNGDDFAERALQAGASVALVSEWQGGQVSEKQAVILVDDTLMALQRLAYWWRSQLDIPVVCITGSNGKTSTKDFALSVLAQKFSVNATRGNLNNHIGLPLSVLLTTEDHTAAIFEIGMNHSGELSPLCEIARPQYGIITNIGTAHIEFLGSREAIAEEKGTLARYLPENGILFTPAGCDFNEYFRARTHAKLVPVGNGRGVVRAENPIPDANGTLIDLVIEGEEPVKVYIPVLGRHMITNALLAAALGWKLGLTPAQIAKGLSSVKLTTGRMRRMDWDGITMLDDSYNANPESMAAALETLREMPVPEGGQRIAVLGKMGELGIHSTEAHRKIGRQAVALGLRLISVGEGAEEISQASGSPHFSQIQDAADWLLANSRPGDVILFKGSRAAAIEQVLQTAFPTAC